MRLSKKKIAALQKLFDEEFTLDQIEMVLVSSLCEMLLRAAKPLSLEDIHALIEKEKNVDYPIQNVIQLLNRGIEDKLIQVFNDAYALTNDGMDVGAQYHVTLKDHDNHN